MKRDTQRIVMAILAGVMVVLMILPMLTNIFVN